MKPNFKFHDAMYFISSAKRITAIPIFVRNVTEDKEATQLGAISWYAPCFLWAHRFRQPLVSWEIPLKTVDFD